MRLASIVASTAALIVTVVACGGATATPDGPDGGTRDGGGTCTVAPLDGQRACVPGTARSNASLTVEVDDPDGCTGCLTKLEPCEVAVRGSTVVLTMRARTCEPPSPDYACPAVCGVPRVTCTIPPLVAGTYDVEVTGQGPRVGLPPRQLVVTDDATATSCTLPSPGSRPEPLDGATYGRSCRVDDDCALVTVGDVCTPCKCPNLAIRAADAATYASDYRARVSACPGDRDPIACAACPPAKAVCKVASDSLVGTCDLGPPS